MQDSDFLDKIAHNFCLVGQRVVILWQEVPPNVSQAICCNMGALEFFVTGGGSDFPYASLEQISNGDKSTSTQLSPLV